MRSPAPYLVLGLGLALAACKESSAPAEPAAAAPPPAAAEAAPAKAAPAAAPTPADHALEIADGTGAVKLRIEIKPEGGYRLVDGAGTKIGKIKVEADRVKVKDTAGAAKAKVKRKDDGFKLYGADETVVLKGKFRGEEGLKLKTGDDVAIGKLKGSSGKVKDQPVAVEVTEGGVVVKRGGAVVAKVKGNLRVEPASLLALEGLDVYQQAALLVFVREVM